MKVSASRKLVSLALVAISNVFVLVAVLALIELGFRLASGKEAATSPSIQWLQFAPFVMFHNPQSGGEQLWSDQIRGTTIRARIINNRHGFAMREEVDFAAVRPKAENERVVVLTGGSAAWGVG